MNSLLPFRPLIGGIGIIPSTTRRWATLGFWGQRAGRQWIVTAGHTIGVPPFSSTIGIYQGPRINEGQEVCLAPVADLIHDPVLDVVAIPSLVACVPEILGLGAWSGIEAPSIGMIVARMGAMTGLAIGKVIDVTNASVEIARLTHYPASYSLGVDGDSGAVWVSWPNRRLICIHRGVNQSGNAVATDVGAALFSLGLSLSP